MTYRQPLALVLLLAISDSFEAQQRDTRPAVPTATPTAAPTGTATVAGTVVADGTSAPLGHATVVLIGARTGVMRVTSASRDGRFSFGSLPADRYTIGASKAPYLGAVAGARRPLRPGVPVVVADGASLDEVTVRLPLGASISGTIMDGYGNPVAQANVVVQQRKMQNGERTLLFVPGGGTQTDDRGRFRVFGLAPGEYVVSTLGMHGMQPGIRVLTDAEVDAAIGGNPPEGLRPTLPMQPAANAPIYYPGTPRVGDALGILVAAGEDKSNIDIRSETVTPSRIDGVVSTADGSPLPQVAIMISTLAGSSPMNVGGIARVAPDGRFTSGPLPPGSYSLLARVMGATPAFAQTLVELTGTDLSGVSLTLQPPLELSGTLVATGTSKPPNIAGHRLQFTSLSPAQRSPGLATVSAASPAGEFRITNLLPGRYTISGAPFFGASGDSVAWGLGSVVIDGDDMTDRAIDIRHDAVPKRMVVTFTDQWQDISGRVTNTAGVGVSDYTLIVFPTDESYWLYQSRRIITTQPDADGRYRIGGPGPSILPAGEYFLAAVTDVSRDEQYDPAFLRGLVPSAIKIVLAPGARTTQDVRVQ